jgi:hypothetical protein
MFQMAPGQALVMTESKLYAGRREVAIQVPSAQPINLPADHSLRPRLWTVLEVTVKRAWRMRYTDHRLGFDVGSCVLIVWR